MIPFKGIDDLRLAITLLENALYSDILSMHEHWKERKRCCRCKQWRKKWYFSPYKKSVDGLDGKCKMCDSKRNKAAYAKRKAKA